MKYLNPLLVLLLLPGAAAAQDRSDPARTHIELYKKVAPAVVAVEQGGNLGSGVIIDPRGYVIASTRTVRGQRSVTIFFQGGLSESASVVAQHVDKELAILKLAGDRTDYPVVKLGSSEKVPVGRVCYVIGDSFRSLRDDGQAAISVGVISGRYELTRRRRGHKYTGPVLETSAACNNHQGGAPLLDTAGRLLGLVTMNYHDARFSGVAIPIDQLREAIEAALSGAPTADSGWFAAEFKEEDVGVLLVSRVAPGGPAHRAGLRSDDIVLGVTVDGEKRAVRGMKDLDQTLRAVGPGKSVMLRVYRESSDRTSELTITHPEKEK